MDIYSAETHVKKLLAYVEDLAGSGSKVYSKSRQKLKDVAETCNRVVELISTILQEEVLKTDADEFDSTPDIQSTLDSMQAQLEQLKKFTGAPVDVPASKPSSSNSSAISTVARKKAMKTYIDTLSKLSSADFSYQHAENCAKILWTWFDTRFIKTVAGSSFKYNMKRFPIWVRNFVILYGKAVRDGTYNSFEDSFQRWIEQLITTDVRDKYAVPYEIYELEKSLSPQDLSFAAVVIWDMLIDAGLSELCTSVKDDLYLDECCIYDLCSEMNPDILDNYSDYKVHPEILNKLGGDN